MELEKYTYMGYLINEKSLNLQWVEKVEECLQEGTDDHAKAMTDHQDEDILVRIIFLSPGTDSRPQKLVSLYDVESWDKK